MRAILTFLALLFYVGMNLQEYDSKSYLLLLVGAYDGEICHKIVKRKDELEHGGLGRVEN